MIQFFSNIETGIKILQKKQKNKKMPIAPIKSTKFFYNNLISKIIDFSIIKQFSTKLIPFKIAINYI
jgi:3-deoxy-D-manno-octulosonic acid (KDO) 8-phosphate synthase